MSSNLWRIWIPTWRLYNRSGPHVRLETGGQPLLEERPRGRWYTLFFNPRGNLYYAHRNLLERFVEEADREVSHRLILDLTEGRAFQVIVE